MSDGGASLLVYAVAGVATPAMLSLAGLRAWRGWLELRREAIAAGLVPGAQVDLGALRARVRKLEAIASGLDG